MSTKNALPEGYHSLTPYLAVEGAAAAIDFYKEAFGAVETMRLPGSDGKVGHAELRIGDSMLMLSDEYPEMNHRGPKAYGGTPMGLVLYVPDVDATVARAVAAGATLTRPVADQFYGDRTGAVTDPFGHSWHIHTHVREVPLEEMQRAAAEMAAKG